MSSKPKQRSPITRAVPSREGSTDDQVAKKITEAFQAYGFDGASLAKISEATGLIKASLYWRFPTGKEAMAQAALKAVGEHFAHYVLKPADEPGPVADRIELIAERLREFYGNGKKECLLDTLTLAGSPAKVRSHARKTFNFWEAKFYALASEAGLEKAEAHHAAQDAIAALEGGLILSRVTGNAEAFGRATGTLSARLTQSKVLTR